MKSRAEKRKEAIERMRSTKWLFSRAYTEQYNRARQKRGLPCTEEAWNEWRKAEIARLTGDDS